MQWYPHYIDDYDADTLTLTLAEDGAYRRLLAWYYKNERPLPDDDKALASIVRITPEEWSMIAPRLRPLFKPNGGTSLHHKRCDAVLRAQAKKRKDGRERIAMLRSRGIG